MIFLRTTLLSSKLASISFSRLASSTAKDLQLNPDLYNGIFTKFGWVLVKKTHVARGWTQVQINKALEKKLGEPLKKPKWETVQKIVDQWAKTADISEIPQITKKTGAQISIENEHKLYLQQLRYKDSVEELALDGNSKESDTLKAQKEPKMYKKSNRDTITFTNAWNYYMAINYTKYSTISPKEARQKVGVDWRQLSLDEKEYYRQEYGKLLKLGKDIMQGKIVDKEVKDRASQRMWESKERTRLRKLGTLPPYDRSKQ